MDDPTLPLPGLSRMAGRPLEACFDGGSLSSDAGVLVPRAIESRLGVADRLARCLDDPRDPALITHSLANIIRFRIMMMIAAGYEDGNAAASLRQDPVFKMAQGIAPSGRHLPRSRRSRGWKTWPTSALCCAWRRHGRSLLRLIQANAETYILDIDDTFDAVHGGQQLRLFNAHYDEYDFQPIVVFDGEGRFVTAVLRPARQPKGVKIHGYLRRLIRAIRSHWPRTRILIRATATTAFRR